MKTLSERLDAVQKTHQHRHGNESYPICFNVKVMYSLNLDVDHIIKLQNESGYGAVDDEPLFKQLYADLSDKEKDWLIEWAQDSVWDGFIGKYASDSWQSTKTETAVIEWTAIGRSSGWLCIHSFDGVKLEGQKLSELFDPEYGYSSDTAEKLLRFVECYDKEITHAMLIRSVEDAVAFNFHQHWYEEAYEKKVNEKKAAEFEETYYVL